MAEFVLVAALLVFVALGLMQLAAVLYARNIAASAAHEGAHTAALADRSVADGESRARELLEASLGVSGVSVSGARTVVDGAVSVQMRVEVPVAVVGAFEVGAVAVTAHAFEESAYGT